MGVWSTLWRRLSGREARERADEMRELGGGIREASRRLEDATREIQRLEALAADARRIEAVVQHMNERRRPNSDRRQGERRDKKATGC